MPPVGPRIIFKDDRDSLINRGCVLYAGHLRPEIIEMVMAAALTAPENACAINVSEGYRDVRDSRDLHEELRAFDISARGIPVPPGGSIERVMEEWARRISERLGPFYQVVVHDTGSGLHIHIELEL